MSNCEWKQIDRTEKPIYHAQRPLTRTEFNCKETEKEVLATMFAVKKFRKFHGPRSDIVHIFGFHVGYPDVFD